MTPLTLGTLPLMTMISLLAMGPVELRSYQKKPEKYPGQRSRFLIGAWRGDNTKTVTDSRQYRRLLARTGG
jgi:hypothetical protein